MSKPDVQSWLSSAGKFDDDGSGSSDSSWQRDQVMKDWSLSMIAAQKILMDSKTSIRLSFLRDELSALAKHGGMYVIFQRIDWN